MTYVKVNDLVFDVVILMLIIVIHNNAFRSEKIQSVSAIFLLVSEVNKLN